MDNIIEKMPDQTYLEATILAKKGLYIDALQLINKLIEKENRPEYLVLKGKILVKMEKLPEATETFLGIKEGDLHFVDAQNALKILNEFISEKRNLFSYGKELVKKNANSVKIISVLMIFFMVLCLMIWNFRLNKSLQDHSSNNEKSFLELSQKIERLDKDIQSSNLIGLKIDSLTVFLRNSQLNQLSSGYKYLKMNLVKMTEKLDGLKIQIDSLSIKNEIKH